MRRGREGSGPASCVAVSASRPFAEEVRAMSATTDQTSELERCAIEPGPRFPTDDERARVMHSLLDVEEFMVDPFARCVFELVNADGPAVSWEEIGRLGVAVEDFRQTLRRMLTSLDRLDEVRDELGRLATYGLLEGPSTFDARGEVRRLPVDEFGHEMPWRSAS